MLSEALTRCIAGDTYVKIGEMEETKKKEEHLNNIGHSSYTIAVDNTTPVLISSHLMTSRTFSDSHLYLLQTPLFLMVLKWSHLNLRWSF